MIIATEPIRKVLSAEFFVMWNFLVIILFDKISLLKLTDIDKAKIIGQQNHTICHAGLSFMPSDGETI